ncbi:hypothetical protein VTL71DRAFT_5013 [Oculimacula yallundae]|uniref:Reticulon domain-containing protein n=1 Tax=Oculimacula yallundae TaxID=86028 RepID=A0ABR4BZY2_9HELO
MPEPGDTILSQEDQSIHPSESNGSVNTSDIDHELQEQTVQIARTIQRKVEEAKKKRLEHNETLKQKQQAEFDADHPSLVTQVASNPSTLYSFVNWENPMRTFGSFASIISLILSTRYFSPFVWVLKLLCIILGVNLTLESTSRVTAKSSILSRVRPLPYYRPSEATYTRLFSELQDASNMTITKLQRIVFAEDLTDTGVAFILAFSSYWLLQTIPSFWLALFSTVFLYSIAPILNRKLSSHDAPNWKPALNHKMQEAGESTVDTASLVASRTANNAQFLSHGAIDAVSSGTNHTAGTAQDFKNRITGSASAATSDGADTAENLKKSTMDIVSQSSGCATTETAKDIKNQVPGDGPSKSPG